MRTSLLLLLLPLALAAVSGPLPAHPGCGIVVDAEGNVYFAFGLADRIYRWSPSQGLTVVAEGVLPDGTVRFRNPHHLFLGADGALYTSGDSGGVVWKLAADGQPSQHLPAPGRPGFSGIGAGGDPFCLVPGGSVVAVNSRQFQFTQLLELTAEGRVRILAEGDWGLADGAIGECRIGNLHSAQLVPDGKGGLYFTQDGTAVRHASADGTVRTLAGSSERGYRNGSRSQARFRGVVGLALAADGALLVADGQNRRIRRVAPDGSVTDVAGSGERGSQDGAAAEASFTDPAGVAAAPDGSIFVLDYFHDAASRSEGLHLRKIDGSGRVQTLATVLPGQEAGR